jgi:methionyl-tRNA formyltransferase
LKLVFMGTPAFAVPTLEQTVAAGHQVVAVFTQPDRPKGRGQKDSMPPVKQAALRLALPVYQPERVRRPEVVEQLRELAPDAMVVVGYGQIIPKAILDIPPHGIINVHASLLPKYRGAAPIQWAIARGETRTGVTTMRINEGLDTGDMLLKWETEIGPDENAVELGARLAEAGADLLVRTLAELAAIQPQPQDDAQATYAPILKKEDGKIDWRLPAREILNRIRGF